MINFPNRKYKIIQCKENGTEKVIGFTIFNTHHPSLQKKYIKINEPFFFTKIAQVLIIY